MVPGRGVDSRLWAWSGAERQEKATVRPFQRGRAKPMGGSWAPQEPNSLPCPSPPLPFTININTTRTGWCLCLVPGRGDFIPHYSVIFPEYVVLALGEHVHGRANDCLADGLEFQHINHAPFSRQYIFAAMFVCISHRAEYE